MMIPMTFPTSNTSEKMSNVAHILTAATCSSLTEGEKTPKKDACDSVQIEILRSN